jgi:hypothetical protein
MLNVKAGRIYRNIKTGEKYRVVFMARPAWDIGQDLVVYEAAVEIPAMFTRWVRSLNEFREKFEEAEE